MCVICFNSRPQYELRSWPSWGIRSISPSLCLKSFLSMTERRLSTKNGVYKVNFPSGFSSLSAREVEGAPVNQRRSHLSRVKYLAYKPKKKESQTEIPSWHPQPFNNHLLSWVGGEEESVSAWRFSEEQGRVRLVMTHQDSRTVNKKDCDQQLETCCQSKTPVC